MKHILKTCIISIATLMLAACAGAPVRTDFDSSARFGGLQAFAWLEPSYETVGDPLLDSQLLGAKVRRAVATELGQRGYLESEPADADFFVTYHTSSRERLRDSAFGMSFGFGRGHYYRGHRSIFVDHRYHPETFQEGTLIIDIIDAGTDRLIWRGWISQAVHRDRFTDAAVNNAVREILSRFPPG